MFHPFASKLRDEAARAERLGLLTSNQERRAYYREAAATLRQAANALEEQAQALADAERDLNNYLRDSLQ